MKEIASLFLRIAFVLLFAVRADAADSNITLNNLTEERDQDGQISYLLEKGDPHIIYSYQEPQLTLNTLVQLNIDLQPLSGTASNIFMEIFWATDEASFSSLDRIRLPIDYGRTALSIPIERLTNAVSAIRIDIDNCDCRMTIADPEWLNYNQAIDTAFPAEISNYLLLKNGHEIPVPNWVGRELKSSSSGVFTFDGWDPRIINDTDLELPLDTVAGVFFDFDYDFSHTVEKFELFWSLGGPSYWSQFRSVHFALIGDPDSTNRKLFIPFEKFYSNRTLRRLRLDFQACINCTFTLNTARIVGWAEIDKYEQYTPQRLYYVNTASSPMRFIATEFLKKIRQDIWFNLFYLVTIFLVILIGSFLVFRK